MPLFRGPWNRVLRNLNNAHDWILGPATDELMAFGLAAKAEIEKEIKDNPHKLALATVRSKERQGAHLPAQAWVEWGDVVKSGLAEPIVAAAKFGRSRVNIPIAPGNHPTGIAYTELINWLEFGNSRQPPRPVIIPVTREIKEGKRLDFQDFRSTLLEKLRFTL